MTGARRARVAAAFGLAAAVCASFAQAQTSLPASAPVAGGGVQSVSHGLFTDVQVFRPAGTPRQFVLMLSGSDVLGEAERRQVQSMTGAGAMVAATAVAPFYERLVKQGGQCTYAAGAFENLSRHVQAFDKLPTYLTPMLLGTGTTGAALAYAVMAQAPRGTFASALTLGFCPRLTLKPPPCGTNALRTQAAADGSGVELQPGGALGAPWISLPGADAACAAAAQAFVEHVPDASTQPLATPVGFDAAYGRLAEQSVALGPPPAQLADLPVVELPVTDPSAPPGRRFAVFLSGDGGWAAIDKGIAAALVKQGVPVAGFDSLRYFWSARTPEGLAADLDRMIRFYAARWKRSEVILIGYSQGADVLPFAVNRLPARTRATVRLTALLGLGQKASFEFHVTNWIGPSGDKPIAPEAQKLGAANTLCVHGTTERDSLCPQLAPQHVRALLLPGDHHFGGDYDGLATRILEAVPPR